MKKALNNIEEIFSRCEDLNYCEDLNFIKQLYEGIISLKEFKDQLPIEEQKYIMAMEIIYNKIIKDLKQDENESYQYLFDYVYNFEDYVNVDYEADDLIEVMLEAYDNNYIDEVEYGGGLKVNPKYEKELIEYNEINEKIITGKIEYTEEEYNAFLNKYSYLNKVAYITDEDDEDDENDEDDNIIKKNNDNSQKKYIEEIIKYYKKLK
jgi:hypothetical protein